MVETLRSVYNNPMHNASQNLSSMNKFNSLEEMLAVWSTFEVIGLNDNKRESVRCMMHNAGMPSVEVLIEHTDKISTRGGESKMNTNCFLVLVTDEGNGRQYLPDTCWGCWDEDVSTFNVWFQLLSQRASDLDWGRKEGRAQAMMQRLYSIQA
tara:strand:- start:576 stop:1034 length:459 start_codon:yes stop_codon:yes gene_type:complete